MKGIETMALTKHGISGILIKIMPRL